MSSTNALGLVFLDASPTRPRSRSDAPTREAHEHAGHEQVIRHSEQLSFEFFSDSSSGASEHSDDERRDHVKQPLPGCHHSFSRSQSLDSMSVWNSSVIPFLPGYQAPDPFAGSRLLRRSSRLSIDSNMSTTSVANVSLQSDPVSESQSHDSPANVERPGRSQTPSKLKPERKVTQSLDRAPTPDRVKAQIRARLTRHTIDDHYERPKKDDGKPVYDVSANPYVKESRVPIGPASHNKRSDLYKTVMCRNWQENQDCRYGVRCQFAHGEEERQKYRQLAAESKASRSREPSASPESAPSRRSVRLSQSVSSLASTSTASSSGSIFRESHQRRRSAAEFSRASTATSGSDTPYTTPGSISVHAKLPEDSPLSSQMPLHHPSPRKQMTQFLLDRVIQRPSYEHLPLYESPELPEGQLDEGKQEQDAAETEQQQQGLELESVRATPWYPWSPSSAEKSSSSQPSPSTKRIRQLP